MSFHINEAMRLTNVNPRAEKHGEEDVPAVDLSFNSIFDLKDVVPIFGPGFTEAALRKAFWDKDGHPHGADHVFRASTVLDGYQATVLPAKGSKPMFVGDGATIKSFTMMFNHGVTVDLSFKIQAQSCGDYTGKLSECINALLIVQIEPGPQTDLDLE